MEILIVRHGDAVPEAPSVGDPSRPLTGEGRRVTRLVASWLAERAEHRPREIWTSPLVRAVQTAEILAERAGLTDEVSVVDALAIPGNVAELLQALAKHPTQGPLALVGHEPSLSSLAAALLGEVGLPSFRKSGVLGVRWDRRTPASLRFLLDPKALTAITELRQLRG